MPSVTTRRERADEYLLAAPAPGWVPQEEIVRLMASLVMPGMAERKVRGLRKRETHGLNMDPVNVGKRNYANVTLTNATRYGVWVRGTIDGVKVIRHRDWADPAIASRFPADPDDAWEALTRQLGRDAAAAYVDRLSQAREQRKPLRVV